MSAADNRTPALALEHAALVIDGRAGGGCHLRPGDAILDERIRMVVVP